jgi:hypothetical protein
VTLSPSNPRAKPRWLVLILSVVLLSAMAGAATLAVHDDGLFELDKNATNNLTVTKLGDLAANITVSATSASVCQTAAAPATPFTILLEAERMTVTANVAGSFGGNCGDKRTYTLTRAAGGTTATAHSKGGVDGIVSLLVSATKPGTDWNQVHAAVLADPNTKCLTLGLVECAYIEDGIGPTTFIGGASKDHLPVSGWQHTTGSSPDKAEILNAYAAKGISTVNGNQILYFGMDRYAVDGSTDIGFWFFKNPVSTNADGTFSGTQAVGDILALGTFTQGGATTNIRVFRWVGTGGNESGTIQGPDGTFGDCVPGAGGDQGCATVNDASIEVPWNYTFKGSAKSGWVPAGGFYEGGIDLTSLGLQGCFSSFLAETRSSPEITAVLKDFALGGFEACDSSLATTPGNGTAGAGNAALSDTNANGLVDTSIGTGSVQVRDRATLTITGIANWSGTLDFWLCGPTALTSTALCDGTTGNVGTKIGGSVAVNQATAQPILSDAATVTSAGRYCWRAEFTSGTTGVPNDKDSRATECFEVRPVTPTLTTNATVSVEIGNPISDTATLSGTANQPGTPVINPTTAGGPAGGTITFRLYGPGDTNCTGTPVFTSLAIPVSGDNNNYNSGNFTPTSAGTYRWTAVYSGDSPNTLGANSPCNAANETTVVNPRQPTILTNATAGPVPLGSSIDDTATLANTAPKPNGDPAGGTITFTAYGPHANTTTCTTVAYTSVVNVSGNGNYTASSGTGGTFTPTAAGTYNWIAVYSGDSPNTLGVSGLCGDANEGSVVISLQPTMTTAQRFVPNDAATITVASGGGNLAGSVVFRLYVNDATCAGTAAYTSGAIDITSGSGTGLSRTVLSGNTTAYTTTGTTFHWVVSYTSTNAAHQNVTSGCGNEHSSITIDNGVQQPATP